MVDRVNKDSSNVQYFTVFVQKQNCAANDFSIYHRLQQMSFIFHLNVPCNGIITRRTIWFGCPNIKIAVKRSL